MSPVFMWFVLLNIISLCSAQCECDVPHQCSGSSLEFETCTIKGYKGAFGANTSFTGNILKCMGAFSCHSMSYISTHDYVACRGQESCSHTTINIQKLSAHATSTSSSCVAMHSCSFSNITITDTALSCGGHLSCRNAYIFAEGSACELNARGSLALYQATIKTMGDSSTHINFDLDGSLAGFGAKIICGDKHNCDITCTSYDACYMLYIDCIGTCHVDAGIGILEPIQNLAELNISQSIPKRFESQAQLPFNDELCTNDILNFDEKQEHMNSAAIVINATTQGPICCRGYQSCAYVTSIQFESKTNNDLVCGGLNSCRDSIVNSHNGSVYCGATSACYNASIIDANDVYCTGTFACEFSTIINANYVFCGAQDSCRSTTIISNGNDLNIFFVGRVSGPEAIIRCNVHDTCNAYCSGDRACEDMTLQCSDNCDIECNEEQSWCPQIEIRHISLDPTIHPTVATLYPSWTPTETTSDPSSQPTELTSYPSSKPILATSYPSPQPLEITSSNPTSDPSSDPSSNPSSNPTETTSDPSSQPTELTSYPSSKPILATSYPSSHPLEITSSKPITTQSTLHIISTHLLSNTKQTNIPTDNAIMLVVVIVVVVVILTICFVIWFKFFYQTNAKSKDDEKQTLALQAIDKKKPALQIHELELQSMDAIHRNTECQTSGVRKASVDTTGPAHMNEEEGFNPNQSEMHVEYNMNAEGDEIVIGDDEITAGDEMGQTNHNTNESDELISAPMTAEGMDMEQCTDCGQVKEGKIYDGNGLFYCNQCYGCYDNDVNQNHNFASDGNTTTKGHELT
eukprot:742578_1